MSYNSYSESTKPSQRAARMQPSIGDVVVYSGQAYLIASILDMTQSLTPDGPTGIHYVLRRSQWIKTLFLIIPARDIEQPFELAA
jgi:hypothetical protein